MKLIQTKEYLLLIDEEAEIKLFDYIFNSKENIIEKIESKTNLIFVLEENREFKTFSKAIAYCPLTKEAEELDLPWLPNPFETINIEELAREETIGANNKDTAYYYFIKGYKAAQSKQFSLEDMRKAYGQGALDSYQTCYNKYQNVVDQNQEEFDKRTSEYFQSLPTQQLPKEFIPKYDEYCTLPYCIHNSWSNQISIDYSHRCDCVNRIKTLKTIINSEGKQELVGKYKY